MFYDSADWFHVVEDFLCVSQPCYKVVQVAMEIVGLLYCLFQFRLKIDKGLYHDIFISVKIHSKANLYFHYTSVSVPKMVLLKPMVYLNLENVYCDYIIKLILSYLVSRILFDIRNRHAHFLL